MGYDEVQLHSSCSEQVYVSCLVGQDAKARLHVKADGSDKACCEKLKA